MSASDSPFRFMLDENVRIEAARFLASRGHDARFAPKGLHNGKLLALSRKESRILVTHDKDFLDPLRFPPAKSAGIVVLRIHPPVVADLIAALSKLIKLTTPALIDKKLIILEKTGFMVK